LARGQAQGNVDHTLTATGADPEAGDTGARLLMIDIAQAVAVKTTQSYKSGNNHRYASRATTDGLNYQVVDTTTGQNDDWRQGTIEVIRSLIVNYKPPSGYWVADGPAGTGYYPTFTVSLQANEANGNQQTFTLASSSVTVLNNAGGLLPLHGQVGAGLGDHPPAGLPRRLGSQVYRGRSPSLAFRSPRSACPAAGYRRGAARPRSTLPLRLKIPRSVMSRQWGRSTL
jgi:hypothetical protein